MGLLDGGLNGLLGSAWGGGVDLTQISSSQLQQQGIEASKWLNQWGTMISQTGFASQFTQAIKRYAARFWRVNKFIELEDGAEWEEPLDELRWKIAKWLEAK